MKKQRTKTANRIKRKNQSLRIRTKNNKTVKAPLRKRKLHGTADIKDKVMPISKVLHPNQAIPLLLSIG